MRKPYSTIDKVLLFSILALIAFGIVMIASIGVPKSIQLTAPGIAYPDCSTEEVQCYYVLKNHLIRVGIGLIAMFLAIKIPYRFWERLTLPAFVVSFCLLISVLIFGEDNNTFAQSWFNIPLLPFIDSIQPTEIAKLGLCIYFAGWLQGKKKELESFDKGFVPFCLVSLAFILPVIAQPDLGSTLVLACIAVGIYFTAGANVKHLAIGGLIAMVVGSLIVLNTPHVKNRFSAFLSTNEECREDYCWQTEQAKIAIGSGGFFGKGLTQGVQKSYWLPQATDDFIFAASSEEIGFIRTAFIVLIFALVTVRGYQVAYFAPDRFSHILASGITTWFGAQVFINIAVNISLMPVTGITLPLVSYGGSSMVFTLLGLGILLNISKYTQNHAYTSNRGRNRGAYFTERINY